MASKYSGVSNDRGRCRVRWTNPYTKKRESQTLDLPYTAVGQLEAFRILQQLKHEQLLEDLAPQQIENSGPVPTFFQMAELMMNITTIKKSSRRIVKSHLNRFWIPAYHDRRIDQIQRKDIKRDFAQVQREYSAKYGRDVLSAGSTVFDVAIDEEWIDQNPVLAISKRVKVPKKVIDPFTFDERDQLLEHITTDRERLFYTLRFFNGMRPGEVIALRHSDIRSGKIHITRNMYRGEVSPPKGNAERVIPVHPEVAKLLKKTTRHFKNGHLVLMDDGTPYNDPNHFSDVLVAAMSELGMRYRSPYNARHTTASMMLHAQMTPSRCAEYLGHSLEMFFRKYASMIEDAQGSKSDEEKFAKAK